MIFYNQALKDCDGPSAYLLVVYEASRKNWVLLTEFHNKQAIDIMSTFLKHFDNEEDCLLY